MAIEWRKDPKLKYTDLCIYVDANMSKIVNPGEYPETEEKIWNYLYLIINALARKKNYFQNYDDYDAYAIYGANKMYFALKKNQINQGKTIHGRYIKPIKSCLNYIKVLLYPMKVEYQNETFRQVLSERDSSKNFDAQSFQAELAENARASNDTGERFADYAESSLKSAYLLLDDIMAGSPFKKGSAEYADIKLTILINALYSMRKKNALDADLQPVYFYNVPKQLAGYIKILTREFYIRIKNELNDCYRMISYDDDLVQKIISNPEGARNFNED